MENRTDFVRFVSWLILVGAFAYLVLFGFNSVTRTGQFSPDSMNYVNVGRNIAAGKGITQPTLGFNQPHFSNDDEIPTSFTSEPPLYPLLIAFVTKLGLTPEKGALLVSATGYVFALLLGYVLARTLYDNKVALLTFGLLLFNAPLRWAAVYAWTETTGIAFILLSILLLTKAREDNRAWLFLAGLSTGLSFAARYALLPMVVVGATSLLLRSATWKIRVLNVCTYCLGFAIPATLVCARNFLIIGSLMPSFNPSGLGLKETVIAEVKTLLTGYLAPSHPRLQFTLIAFSAVLICVAFVATHDRAAAKEVLLAHRRYLITLWSFSYLLFLVMARSSFDLGDAPRLIIPAEITLIFIWSAFAARAAKIGEGWLKGFVVALFFFAIFREVRTTSSPVLDFGNIVPISERLSWVETNTSDHDLIIGDDTMDIPFYFKSRPTLSFSLYPNSLPPTYNEIMAYCRRHCAQYQSVYLVLRRYPLDDKNWRLHYGDFFADLAFGHLESYPEVVPIRRLSDAFVFQVQCR